MNAPSLPRIAIIDDDDKLRSSLTRLLRLHGLDPVGFASAEAFLAEFGSLDFDCALMDLHLPALTGIEAMVAAHAVRPDLPVVVMTGFAETGTAAKCSQAGAVAFLTKPFAASALMSVLNLPQ
ncbi:response regulator transcription factor [Pseudooceanicola algae]|uniref:Response regulator protein TmoT n=1 Tax=Pseudooceanicola algae TaxID=1537215 RepID=A0A418SHP8_9RHOB|nr:response regulator [Pseudooceanicola algae]QPM90272.1 Response regulator protein TmoT [Pseudooceanicola algae]